MRRIISGRYILILSVRKSCTDLLCGKDLQGNEICSTKFPIAKASNEKAADNGFELILKSGNSEPVLVNVGS
ncbi:MAG: hypothetical protein DIZ80_09390 [endosymbiont of Galathealinum brachiosum]|uniref:Uncharacterized protein n=1 Tax=endosymbiont of Galathealinum brachiosum TaxID=2200906 RepID=A0A370DD35_9GAMM|nr:MAG: hypothetical protein DIZ80_09390 [endosymbiont of Galathealinum brachiosum]